MTDKDHANKWRQLEEEFNLPKQLCAFLVAFLCIIGGIALVIWSVGTLLIRLTK